MKALNKITLITILAIFSSFSAVASNSKCMEKKNVLCQSIIKLNPYMDHDEAYKLSNYFHKNALKYKVPSKVLVAIAFQESAFKQDTVRKVRGYTFDEVFGYKEVKIGADFCMMQINIKNIRKMELDVEQLLNDPKYCIEAGARVLSEYREKYGEKDPMWWAYYNATSKYKREVYHTMVSRHLNKISGTRKIASNEQNTNIKQDS